MNTILKLTSTLLISSSLLLSGCNDDDNNNNQTVADTLYGPFSTGTTSEPNFVYYDLDTMSTVALTEEAAKTDTQWDIAFKRTKVYLNPNNSDEAIEPVSAYFTGNNAEFYDAEGTVIVDKFVNATAEDELDDFTAITLADIPTDDSMFSTDESNNILDGFYNYDVTTHQVSAAGDKYFIVKSDAASTLLSKFRVTDLTQNGFSMSAFTLNVANQANGTDAFATTETVYEIDAATECAGSDSIYIDFDITGTVTVTDAWDIQVPCNADSTGAEFELHLAETATAIQDFENSYTGIAEDAIRYYGFKSDEYTIHAMDKSPWYQYNIEGNHKLWSQFGVYLIKNANGVFKLQITSYYDAEGASGNYSFRAKLLDE